jgi:hypothetical protein
MELPARLPILLTLCIAGHLMARPKTDTVVMNNGDRFTCEIKKLEQGVLYANLDYVDGTVSLQWSKVARVESQQLFIVNTQDGSVYEGTLRTPESAAEEPTKIEILEPAGDARPLEQAKVVELAQTSPSLLRRLSGNFDSGLSYAKGNDATQYNLGAQLRLRSEHWRMAADFASNLSNSSGVDAATRYQARVWARRLIGGKRKWYYSGLSEFLQSSQQGINLQTTLAAGFGRFLRDSNSQRLALTSALAWQKSNYEPTKSNLQTPNTLAGMITVDLHTFRFKKTSFDLTASMLPMLNEWGRVRSYVNSAYSIQMINSLWLKLTFYGSWDNRPPPGFAGSDYGATTGISYSFN